MLHKLVTAPMRLVKTIGEKVQEEVDQELYDLPTIQQKLIHLQAIYEQGDLPEVEFKVREADLLTKYENAKQRELEQWEEMTKRRD
ncbi:gas vesicle protein GvpG [Gracilibacillus dipsosauri]|uniref:Gas vesicle protein GvpG n=1 Tax=Gracilibacillus dipsosauri TaxID=178340 RepID=A0A317L4G3_9BACI|nr:gas vesicle protein GvpG [Gracilibacillus dipsosauri]PWU69788.1 gas vesicle protein GvpG [Gracilibacillus dipsosauri]